MYLVVIIVRILHTRDWLLTLIVICDILCDFVFCIFCLLQSAIKSVQLSSVHHKPRSSRMATATIRRLPSYLWGAIRNRLSANRPFIQSPCGFLTFFPKRFGCFNQFLRTYYTFLSTLEYKFLFNYLQLWRSYASETTHWIFYISLEVNF